jgi:hypothetical protein
VLSRDPAEIAQSLERRYGADGYPAARVHGSFDAGNGTLLLDADEGRLAEVVIEGLSEAEASRARQAAGLARGDVVRRQDILAAFDRIETASEGALRMGEDRLEVGPGGARLVLRPERSRFSVRPLIGAGELRSARRYNRVDGLNLALGAELTVLDAAAYNHWRIHVLGAYGWSSKKLRHATGLSRTFGARHRLALGYEHHDLTDSDDRYRAPGLEEAPGTALVFQSYTDYFRRRGNEVYAFARMSPRVQIGLSWRADDHRSLPVVTSSKQPNPSVPEGLMRSLIATARFSSAGDLHPTGAAERGSFLQRSLYGVTREPPRAFRAEATFEHASPALGGDFDFRRLIANLRGHRALSERTAIEGRVLLGHASGAVPLQKRFSIGGIGTLRGYPNKVFPGESMALATVEWRFDPGRLLPRLAVFYDGGSAWTAAADGPGWKSALGAGAKWPAQAPIFVRVDVARAVGDPDQRRIRALVRVQLSF